MKVRYPAVVMLAFLAQVFCAPQIGSADKVRLPDGTAVEGIVKSIDNGQVTIEVNGKSRVFDILEIAGIDFDTPRLAAGTPRLPLEHFLGNIEAQELVGHFRDVEESAATIRKLIGQTKEEWADRKSIAFGKTAQWETAKKPFRKPLSRYQEVLNDLYFHVLGKVDEYNTLMKEADSVYVGVKGWFQTGSSLIPSDMERLPLKKYVPGNWYDTIYFEGYDAGYRDAAEKYRRDPYRSME